VASPSACCPHVAPTPASTGNAHPYTTHSTQATCRAFQTPVMHHKFMHQALVVE
jgi:hypothetical protein